MKKSIKNLEVKEIKNSKAVKGGTYGSGTRKTSSQSSTQAELL
jgi:hypothetical protein